METTRSIEDTANAFNRFEAQGWERVADAYDDFFTPVTERVADDLLDASATTAGTRVLDVACGPGTVAARAAARGAQATGIDISQAMIARARLLHPECTFRQTSAESLPFGDASLDAGVGNFAILHLGRPERAADELARVVAPGGRVGLTVWDLPERCPLLGLLVEAVGRAGAKPSPQIPAGPSFFRFSEDAELAGLLVGAGFEKVDAATVELTHTLPGPEDLWEGLLRSTVRTAPLVRLQDTDTQRRIRQIFDGLAERYVRPDGFVIPVSVKLASGVRA